MSAPIIQAQYDSLEEIARRFDAQADNTEQMVSHLVRKLDQLERGGWEGDAADAFFREMNDAVLPTTNNLRNAFYEARDTTRQIVRVMEAAEDDAGNQFQITNSGGQSAGGGGGAGGGSIGSVGIGGGSNAGGAAGGSAGGVGASASPASSTLVQTPTDQVFDKDYMDDFIGSHYQGEDSAELNQLMEDLAAADPSDTASVDQLLNRLAAARGVDPATFRQQYEIYQQLLANQGGLEAIDLGRHGDFLGSTASMRYGAVVGDVFGIDPVFGSLLNPTGGLVGPGNDAYNPGDNDAIGYHGIFHDAAGYLYNNHDVGPGYDYLDSEPFDTASPQTGQLSGVSWWAGAHPELDVDFSNAHEAFDIPYVPEFIEAGITGALADLPIINVVRLPMHIYEGGSDIVDGIGDILDGDFSEGVGDIADGIGTIGGGIIRYAVDTIIDNPIVNGIVNGLKSLFG